MIFSIRLNGVLGRMLNIIIIVRIYRLPDVVPRRRAYWHIHISIGLYSADIGRERI